MAFLKVNQAGKINYINLDLVVFVEQVKDGQYNLYTVGGAKFTLVLTDDTSIKDLLGDVRSFLKDGD